jgi:hypothetical protein
VEKLPEQEQPLRMVQLSLCDLSGILLPKLPASSEETVSFAFPQNQDFRYTFAGPYISVVSGQATTPKHW